MIKKKGVPRNGKETQENMAKSPFGTMKNLVEFSPSPNLPDISHDKLSDLLNIEGFVVAVVNI